MKNMMTKQLNREQWISFATTMLLVGWMLFVFAVSVSAADRVSTDAGPEGPAQTAYAPPDKPGPVIIVISGQSGPIHIRVMLQSWLSLATTRSSSPARISLTLNLLARPI